MALADVMTRHPRSCSPDDTLDAVARTLWERDVGVVPVVNGAMVVVGMITDRDVCMAAYTQGRPLRELRASTAMSKAVHLLHPDEAIEDALRVMRERQVRRLPVTDDEGKLLGVVSLADLARRTVTGEADARDVVDTLVAVTRPRVEAVPIEAAAPPLPATRDLLAPPPGGDRAASTGRFAGAAHQD